MPLGMALTPFAPHLIKVTLPDVVTRPSQWRREWAWVQSTGERGAQSNLLLLSFPWRDL
jgi:hypothetical protein